MLCSNCYKKIPEGEEVKRGGSNIYWRVGGWYGDGGGSGVFCVRCAKREARRQKKLLVMFFCCFFGFVIFILLTLIFTIVWGRN